MVGSPSREKYLKFYAITIVDFNAAEGDRIEIVPSALMSMLVDMHPFIYQTIGLDFEEVSFSDSTLYYGTYALATVNVTGSFDVSQDVVVV